MLPSVGPLEIVVLLVIALLVFGPKRLPEMGRSVGKGIKEFRNSVTGSHEEPHEEIAAVTSATAPAKVEAVKVEAVKPVG